MKNCKQLMFVFAILVAFMVKVVFFPGPINAGDLEPTDPPGSTMHTLDEIYQKLDSIEAQAAGNLVWTGTSDRFTDNQNGTVTDNLTGLIWLKDANCFVDLKTWQQAMNLANGLSEGQCGLTDGSSAGDWRLPSIKELASLIDYSTYGPALPPGHPFLNVQNTTYFSSTNLAWNTNSAWFMTLGSGYTNTQRKDYYCYVWFVRGGQ